MGAFTQIQPVSLREQIVDQVRQAIIEGRLKPKDHITEALLTSELGVSRTPVREALILLEREGLVVSTPNRGAFVRAFNRKDVSEIFSMRATLENFAAELIIDTITEAHLQQLENMIEQQRICIEVRDFKNVRRVDMDFHHSLIRLSDNALLTRYWMEIVAQIAALLYIRAEALPDYDEYLAIRDHRAILAAYRSGRPEIVFAENRRINERVAEECRESLRILGFE